MPGILDSHHHIIEPFVKALTGGERAQLWKRFWLPLEASLTEGTAYLGAAWTFLEAMRGGITTIVDHGIRTREIANAIHRAAADTGIRLVSFRAIFLSADPPERGVEASYETVRRRLALLQLARLLARQAAIETLTAFLVEHETATYAKCDPGSSGPTSRIRSTGEMA